MWEYIIIGIILLIILLAILKANKKDAKIDFNKLVEYLGIQKLGAKGIVEIDNQLKIILGQESSQIKRYIDDLKRK